MTPSEKALIVQECTQLIARFANANDARDYDALAAMFVEDGVFCRPTMPDQPIRGRKTIIDGFRSRPANKLTRHVCTNIAVEAVSETEARATSYIILYTATVEEGAALPVKADAKQLVGAFRDTIVSDTDGVWKFRERLGSLAMTLGG